MGRRAGVAALGAIAVVMALLSSDPAAAETQTPPRSPAGTAAERALRLPAAYPEFIDAIDGNWVVWRDKTRTPLDDGRGVKPFDAWLGDADIEDMFQIPYPMGEAGLPPEFNIDPGRARNDALFEKMYGDCRKGEVAPRLVSIPWLPKRSRQRVAVTRVNGVAERLKAVSAELDALPRSFDRFLVPSAGTYKCRVIAGTDRPSTHGYGIAIDLAVAPSNYWRWERPGPDGRLRYRNSVPMEIVRIFERHGFLWGGKWYHYDTMHFEYRPELVWPELVGDTPVKAP